MKQAGKRHAHANARGVSGLAGALAGILPLFPVPALSQETAEAEITGHAHDETDIRAITRGGQSGVGMVVLTVLDIQDQVDILSYAQTLPAKYGARATGGGRRPRAFPRGIVPRGDDADSGPARRRKDITLVFDTPQQVPEADGPKPAIRGATSETRGRA